jgi:hypothetical protein
MNGLRLVFSFVVFRSPKLCLAMMAARGPGRGMMAQQSWGIPLSRRIEIKKQHLSYQRATTRVDRGIFTTLPRLLITMPAMVITVSATVRMHLELSIPAPPQPVAPVYKCSVYKQPSIIARASIPLGSNIPLGGNAARLTVQRR